MQTQHVPVMLEEVLKFLRPAPGGRYIDGTLGGGGHTEAILERSAPDGKVLGIDTDVQALARVRERLAESVSSGRLVLAHGNFAELARIVNEAGFVSVQGILLDLGFSSHQMDNPERGFSFSADGPLDMRLDQSQEMSAADLVNSASEQELADIIWRYGEETRSRQIAKRIVRERAKGAITHTAQLARLAAAGVPFKPGAIHPATKTFQALRIAVNHELEQLEAVLPQILDALSTSGGDETDGKQAGRMVIISFHSLEDRIVKEFMRREARDCICPPHVPICVCGHKARLRLLTTKPVIPTAEEVIANPRARSAKLRAAEIVVSS
jgi:16S rRNA (cytosine1402-N4)-methyltransferase